MTKPVVKPVTKPETKPVTRPVLDTPLTRLAGVRHPIVQTGMGWVAGDRKSVV